MSRSRFDEVLDACVADILGGRRTVAECLEEWPQHRERLEPLLDAAAAMHRIPRVAEVRPDPARRAQFMAALLETSQQSPRSAPLRALAALGSAPQAALGALSTFGRVGAVAAPAAALAVAAIALTLVLNRGTTTTAYASTLTVFAGAVEQQVDGAWRPLADGAALQEGARLRTDGEGSALLTFADGSTASIEPNTELVIELARVNGSRRIRLHQFAGRLWNDVAPDDRRGALYVVETPDAIITARGTLFETVVEEGETAVSTANGLVELEAGDEKVFVAPGERVSARAHRLIAARQAAQKAQEAGAGLRLAVDAPFVASLVAPNGKAVGARPDGIVYQQLAGATSTNPGDGPQRIELRQLPPGTYQLLLRRVEEGSGEIVLTVGPDELRFPVDRVGDAVRVELEVSIENGKLRVRPSNVRAVDPGRIERHERIIVTELAKKRAISIAEQRRQHAADVAPPPGRERPQRSPQRPDTRPASRATPTVRPLPTAQPSDARPRPANRRPDATPARPTDTDGSGDPLSLCRRLLDSADLNEESTVAARCRSFVDQGVTTARELCQRLEESGDLKQHPQLAKRCRTALNDSTSSNRTRTSNWADAQREASGRSDANDTERPRTPVGAGSTRP